MHGLPADLTQVRHVRKRDLTELALPGSQFTQLEQFRAELEVAAVGALEEAVLGQLGRQPGGGGLRQARPPGQFGDPHRQVPGVERAQQGRRPPHHGVESVPLTGTHGLMMTVAVATLQGPFILQKLPGRRHRRQPDVRHTARESLDRQSARPEPAARQFRPCSARHHPSKESPMTTTTQPARRSRRPGQAHRRHRRPRQHRHRPAGQTAAQRRHRGEVHDRGRPDLRRPGPRGEAGRAGQRRWRRLAARPVRRAGPGVRGDLGQGPPGQRHPVRRGRHHRDRPHPGGRRTVRVPRGQPATPTCTRRTST